MVLQKGHQASESAVVSEANGCAGVAEAIQFPRPLPIQGLLMTYHRYARTYR